MHRPLDMKVLIISTNQEKTPFAVVPIGALKVVAALRQAGHQVDFLDLCFCRNIRRSIKKRIKSFAPDIVGLSIRNLDNCAYDQPRAFFDSDRNIVQAIRDCSEAQIVIGGSAVSIMPEELADYLGVDYAIAGEGEESLPALLQALQSNTGLQEVPGLLRRNGSSWLQSPGACLGHLQGLPLQAYDCIDLGRYFAQGGLAAVQTKRGCPFSCIYCVYPALEGRLPRLVPPGECVQEMERIVKDTGRSDFFFVDGVFNYPTDHAAAVCEEIIRRRLNVRWLAYCNPVGLDKDLAELFKASGCAGIELGLDAATEKMLCKLKKGFTLENIKSSYVALNLAGIPFAVFLLFGGPEETYADWEQTQKNLQGFGSANAVFASLGIRIYAQTCMHDIAVEQGYVTQEMSLLQPCFYISPQLLEDDPVQRLDALARRDPAWSTPTDWNSLRVRAIQWLLAKYRVIPCWRDIRNYGAYMRRQG
ncbi:MAG: lipid biosynthesis B12-binding/radical SAM protein [Desulfohalobiaceae bacterium]